MKKIILIIVLTFTYSCKSQNQVFSDLNNNCNISEVNNQEEFDKIYSNIEMSNNLINQLDDFNNISSGVFFLKLNQNTKSEKSSYIKVDNSIIISKNYKGEVAIKEEEKKVILNNFHSIVKNFYFEQCKNNDLNNGIYLLIIRMNNETVLKYLTYDKINFHNTKDDENITKAKNILEIMDNLIYR